MNDSRHLIASNLTMAFYAGTEGRRPYLGEERRRMLDSPIQPGRIPTLSLSEVFLVYQKFLSMLDSAQAETAGKGRPEGSR